MAGPSRRLLLAAAVLGSCLQPAPAQLRIAITAAPPPAPRGGGSVTLALQPPPAAPIPVCTWYRAAKSEAGSPAEILTYAQGTGQRNGTGYTGRETGRPDCSLHIAGLLLNDSSPYSLWLPATGDLVTVNVTVFGTLSQPKVTPPSPTCKAGSMPAPRYEWFHNDTALPGAGQTLTLAVLGWGQQGTYRCEGHNPVTELTAASRPLDLRLWEMLSQPKVTPPSPTVVENSTLELTCEAPPSTEALLWERDGSVLVPGGRVGLSPGNRTLTVRGVGRDDAGNYTCEVRNPVSHNRSHPVTVTVAYGPDAATITPPGPLDRATGSALGLTCEAGSVPAPQYGWFHNDTALPGAGQTLTLAVLGWGQQGMYRCEGHNPVTGLTAASHPLDLRLWEMLSQPKVTPPSPTVVENSTLELTCEAPPSTEVLLWERDGSVLVPGGRVGLSPGNRSLTVRGVGRDDTGNYTCEVRNPISAAQSKGDIVTVIYGPVTAHITPPGPLHPLLGDNVTLTCAADAFPAPQFHWSHNGSDRVPALTGAVLSLALRGTEQTGVFECRATNPRTGRSATASVSIGQGQQAGPSLSAGAVAGITLAAVVLGGALACVLFRHSWRKTPRDSKESPPVYENVTPQASVGAVAQPGSSPDPTYQTLQPGTRDLYEELRT